MPGAITLTIRHGSLAGRKLVFDKRQKCLVGRSAACDLRLSGCEFLTVSRYHCLLEIDPPAIAVRDLGSRNGTYVSDVRLGNDATDSTQDTTRRELKDGDELRVGDTVFLVHIDPTAEAKSLPRAASADTKLVCEDATALV